MLAGDSKLKPPATLLSRITIISKYTPIILPVLEELGSSEAPMARYTNQVGFFGASLETRGLN